jgi:hypothetical protein
MMCIDAHGLGLLDLVWSMEEIGGLLDRRATIRPKLDHYRGKCHLTVNKDKVACGKQSPVTVHR